MIIRALVGPAGSGKTAACIAALRECERQGRRGLLLVPDQFTYAADRLLLESGELTGTRLVQIQSFHRLAATLLAGGRRPLSDAARRMLLRAVVLQTPLETLGPLAAVRETPGFIEALAALLREIKGIAGRAAAQRLLATGADDPKVAALAAVVAAYDQALDQADLEDPEERIHAAAAAVAADPGPWRDRPIWIDGFASYTPEDKVLLAELARAAEGIALTLCADPDEAAWTLSELRRRGPGAGSNTGSEVIDDLRPRLTRPVFLPTLRTLAWLAETYGDALTLEPLPAVHRWPRAAPLARLEAALFTHGPARPAPDEGGARRATESVVETVRLLRAPHPYREVQAWARLIDRWTRLEEPPLRYREIGVIVRDLEGYRPHVLEIFARYAIPCFIDERRDATAHPRVRLVLSALQLAARGWTRELVIGLLRNPLLAVPPEQVDRIEHLSVEYGVEYERWWETTWEIFALPQRDRLAARGAEESEGAPDSENDEEVGGEGDGGGEEETPVARGFDRRQRRRELAAAEARAVCARVFPSWRAFCDGWRGGPLRFTEAAGAVRALLATTGEDETAPLAGWSADENRRVADLLDETLATGERLMGDVPIDAPACSRLLRDALARASIGQTPRNLDAVVVAEPRRARVNEVRAVIVGGLDAAAFPRLNEEDALFSDRERRRLSARGLPMAYTAAHQAEEDPFLFYIATTRATERLVLSYATRGSTGDEHAPSLYVGQVERALGPAAVIDDDAPGLGGCLHACELPHRLARELGAAGTPLAARPRLETACRALLAAHAGELETALACADRLAQPMPERLDAHLVAQLYPTGQLATSVTRIESFARCPFQYFARYVLDLQPPPEPMLTPRSTGSAAHDALQRIFTEDLPTDRGEISARVQRIFAALAQQEDYRVFQEDPPSAYRWARTRRAIEFFLRAEIERLATADFQPRGTEIVFGDAGRADPLAALAAMKRGEPVILPAVAIEIDPAAGLPRDRTWGLRLTGRIDRLDIDAQGRRALVIDYKQSGRTGSVHQEIRQGLDFQVALYLLAVEQGLGLEPAAGVYYGFSPQPRRTDGKQPSGNPLGFRMRGIFADQVQSAIDPLGGFLDPRPRSAYPDVLAPGRIAELLQTCRRRLRGAAREILGGRICARPVQTARGLPCDTCDYARVCRFDLRRHPVRVPSEEEDADG